MPYVVRKQPFDLALQHWIQAQVDDCSEPPTFNRPEILLRINGDVPQGNSPRLANLAQESAKVSHEWVRHLCQWFPALNASLQLGPESQMIEQRQFKVPCHVVRVDTICQELQRPRQQIEDCGILLSLLGQTRHHLDHMRGVPIRIKVRGQCQVGVDRLRTGHHIEVAPLHQHEL